MQRHQLFNNAILRRTRFLFGILYIKYYFPAVEQLADPTSARIALIENIQNIVPRSYNLQQDEELKKCFLMENVDHQALTNFAIHHLKLKHNIQSSDKYDDSHILAIIKKITSDDLFLLCLEKTFITDADLELLMTKVRRAMLFKHFEENGINPTDLKVIGALALQGLNNEYVFGTDDIEDELVSALSMSIEQLVPKLGTVSEDLERALFVFGMYDRIYSLSCKNQLSGIAIDSWSATIRPLLEQSLRIPIEEERIKQGIVSISSIDDKTSQLVQSQYEVNPYPRWLTIPALMKTSIRHHLKLLFPHFVAPDFLDGPLRVLVAGCGTGRHPIEAAIFYENVEITAVDISKSSLA